MLDPETKRTLITCCTTAFGTISAVIITQLFTYLNSKGNKTDSIYKQQYDNVFSPIHKILFFTDLEDNDKIEEIYNIIYNNYNLSTELLRKKFNKCTSKNIITSDFKDVIKDGCKCLEKALGYTKTKLSKQQKEQYKTVIYSDEHITNKNFLFSLVIIIITILMSIATMTVLFVSSKLNIDTPIGSIELISIIIGIIPAIITLIISTIMKR